MRLIIISNRLPVSVSKGKKEYTFTKSGGGLVSGLTDFLNSIDKSESDIKDYIWMGWPGTTIEKNDEDFIRNKIQKEYKASPVFLSQVLMDKVYYGFCNKTIWPLFHYFPNYASFENEFWDEYKNLNEIFCDEVLRVVKPGDVIWVHDYHLMLLPAMLRKKIDNPIGFFLHIPFPSFEMFRLFPKESRDGILNGLLGSDLIGFHTHDYSQYFLRTVLRILGIENYMGKIQFPDRITKVNTYPMGIEFEKFHNMDVSPFDSEKPAKDKPRIVLSVDRLDYTKGIINRLQGFEMFLKKNPDWHGKVFMNMILVPSRTGVSAYKKIKRKLDELVGNINGNYGTVHWTPIVYQYTSLPHKELIAQYRMSDVSLITPLRDGMNLVAKEYVASLQDHKGVLILSEFTGAAKELSEAIIINPNNIVEIADSIARALSIPEEDQIYSNKLMQKRLKRYNVKRWAHDFVESLIDVNKETRTTAEVKYINPSIKDKIVKSYKKAKSRIVILNYDGTLVPFHKKPGNAYPPEDLLKLLSNLNKNDKTDIVIISGRSKYELDNWLGKIPVNLTAEHGVWIREAVKKKWELFKPLSNEWKEDILPILELYTDRLPGSYIEEKEYSITWHYHKADIWQSSFLVKEVTDYLLSMTTNMGVQVFQGKKVIEVSNADINKGELARHWLSRKNYDFILSMGSGWSDELLFQMLPPKAWTIGVGKLSLDARYIMKKQEDVIELLQSLEKH